MHEHGHLHSHTHMCVQHKYITHMHMHMLTHGVMALEDRICEIMNGLIKFYQAIEISEVHPYTEAEGYLRDNCLVKRQCV